MVSSKEMKDDVKKGGCKLIESRNRGPKNKINESGLDFGASL